MVSLADHITGVAIFHGMTGHMHAEPMAGCLGKTRTALKATEKEPAWKTP